MAKKKKSYMGIEERKFFEMFEPKPPPRTLWERLFGRLDQPAAGPGSQPPVPPPSPSPPPPPAGGRPMPPLIDARHWFDIPATWAYVLQNVADERWRMRPEYKLRYTLMLPIFEIAKPTHDVRESLIAIAQYFGIPDAPFHGPDLQSAWDRNLVPYIIELERQINLERPQSLKGSVRFDFTTPLQHGLPDGGYWMSYYQ